MSEKMIVACPECRTRFVAPLEKFLPDGRRVRCAKCGHAWFQQPEAKTATPEIAETAPKKALQVPPPAPSTAETAPKTESIMDRAAQAAASASVIERADQRRAEIEATKLSVGTTSIQEAPATVATDTEATPVGTAITADPGHEKTAYGNGGALPKASYTPAPRRSIWPRALFYTLAAAVIAGVAGYFFKDPISKQIPSLGPHLSSWHDTVDGAVAAVIPPNRTMRIENVKYDFEEIEGGKALLVSAVVTNGGQAAEPAAPLAVTLYDSANTVLHETTMAPQEPTETIQPQESSAYLMRLPLPPKGLDRVEVDFAE